MKKILIISLVILITGLMLCIFFYFYGKENLEKYTIIKNDKFSIILPKNLKGFYESEIGDDKIMIYDKNAKKEGFGGFAFGIVLYKNPAEHAQMPGGKKIGEFKDDKNVLYDVVLVRPTDVQYNYTKPITESYKNLYDFGNDVRIEGLNGNKYYKNQGMKGKYLYKNILHEYVKILNEKKDSTWFEKNKMSYMYNVLAQNSNAEGKSIFDKVGFTFDDINADGIEELLIGEIADGDWKGVVYDIYTMVDRKPEHVLSGGSRNRFFVCNDVFLCNEYSSGAEESGMRVYILLENSTEIFPQVGFKYDGYTNKKSPWFLSYGDFTKDSDWENVSEEKYKERKSTFDKYKRFNYIPFSKIRF